MSYEDGSNSGGCLSAVVMFFFLPYIIAFYGYMILALMVVWIIEWVGNNIFTIMLYGIPLVALIVVVKLGLISDLYQWIKVKQSRSSYQLRDLQESNYSIDSPSEHPRVFTPSSNLYCYWCTRKLGFQSWERDGKYYCQDCYDKGRL